MITITGYLSETLADTVVVLVGTDDETGEIVNIAADFRPAHNIIAALHAAIRGGGDHPQVDPEAWAIIRRYRLDPRLRYGHSPQGIAWND